MLIFKFCTRNKHGVTRVAGKYYEVSTEVQVLYCRKCLTRRLGVQAEGQMGIRKG